MGIYDVDAYGFNKAVVAGVILAVFISICLFMLFLLLHGDHRHILSYQLAANAIISHLPAAFFLHPASIHLDLLYKPLTMAYCWLYVHIEMIYQMITPYMLFMFTIERLMYIRDPTGYAQKIKRAGAIVLLAFPWAFITLYTIITINAQGTIYNYGYTSHRYDSNFTIISNHTRYTCGFMNRHMVSHIMRGVIGILVPCLACLIITITVLIMWCCYKRKMSLGRDYAMMGEQVEATVRDSVICVALLNFLYIPIFIFELIVGDLFPIQFTMISLFGVVETIVWIGTLARVRHKFVGLFRCCCPKKSADRAVVNYSANETISSGVNGEGQDGIRI